MREKPKSLEVFKIKYGVRVGRDHKVDLQYVRYPKRRTLGWGRKTNSHS
jgi:hypothetical protein